ncbi:MAG: dihydrofolate reductase [Patescibacteria group bacterium]
MIRLIVAIDRKRGIAKDGVQPWKIPEDEQYFASQTKTHGGVVLIGSSTFKTFKGPLKDRQNFVLTHAQEPIQGATLVHDLAQFLDKYQGKDLWVAGGASLYQQIIDANLADELYITHIDADFDCEQFFPDYEDKYTKIEETTPHHQSGLSFTYAKYVRSTH